MQQGIKAVGVGGFGRVRGGEQILEELLEGAAFLAALESSPPELPARHKGF